MRLSPIRFLPLLVGVVLGAAACGADTGSSSPAQSFPVTLLRKGGVAGFDNRVVVTEDGRVTATGRGAARPCTLEPAALEDLTALASRVEGTAQTTYEMPDDLILVVQTPTGSSRLGDLDQSEHAGVVSRLFDELFSGQTTERSLCR